jgi:hypothetical protein
VAPLRGSLGPGPQLHVAPDGTIRYLAATDPSGYKGKHRIWQRSADGKVQAFGLPKGMVQTVDFAYTVKQTYLGKPDKSGGYLVVQYNGDTKDRKLRAAYVPHGVDPSTVSASVQASGEGKSPRLFLSSPSRCSRGPQRYGLRGAASAGWCGQELRRADRPHGVERHGPR